MAVTINIPSQVKTYANLAAFPASGSLKTIYIAEDTNKTYRWDGSTYVEISASAATGLTVGTTPIASGTIGRVLFQGTGNVLQQSGNLFWDNTNGRLGIGTSSPSAIIHSVGTVNASAAIGRGNFLNNTLVASANNDVLAALDIQPTFTNGAFTGVLNHSIRTSQNTGIAIAIGDRSNQLGFANPALISLGASYGTNGLGNINNAKLLIFDGGGNGSSSAGLGYSLVGGAYQFEFFTQSNYVWSIGNGTPARTPQMRMFSTGNLLLQNGGTFTDAGFRLDVNGTARVQGALNVTTSVTANTASSGTGYEGYKIQDGANARFVAERLVTNFLGIGHNSTAGRWDDVILGAAQRLYFYTGASERARFAATTGNLLINTTTDAGYKLDVNGTARVSGNFNIATGFELNFNNANVGLYRSANSLRLGGYGGIEFLSSPTTIASQTVRMVLFDTGNLCIGNTLDVASARLIVNSTTQGFLPPRMTTTQKNAIASPATGLMVYDTTLNRPCFYDGTTWITL